MSNNLVTMSTTKKDNSAPKKYKVRSGTFDSGKEYEINNLSLLALRSCFEELEEFWIASNVDGFGEMDDIVMFKKRKESNKGVTYLMQLKHQDTAKPIATSRFLKDTGDYSFEKYSKCYCDMQKKIETETKNTMLMHLKQNSETVFIIFTNKSVLNKQESTDRPDTERLATGLIDKCVTDMATTVQEFLIKIHETSPILDDIGCDGDIFKIDYAVLAPELKINVEFLEKLHLFTNQLPNHCMEEKIKNILIENLGKKLQLSDEDVSDNVLKFVKFVGQWAKGALGGHYQLTKENIMMKLVELLLFRYKLTVQAEDNDERLIEEDIWWYDITKNKDVTVIDDADDVVQQYVRNVTNKIICHKSIHNSINNVNRHLMRVVKNCKNLSKSERYELLWKTGKIPLVLEVLDERGVRYIREVLKQFPKVFRVIILNKTKIHFEEFGDLKLFTDLSTKHQEYILNKPIKLQGREGSCIHKLNINLKLLKVKDVVYILCDQFNVGRQFDDVPQFFVEMSLTADIFDIGLLKFSEDIFVFRCGITLLDKFESILRNQLGIDAKKIIHWERLNQANFYGQIIIFNGIENLKEIEAFCLTLTKPVHFFTWHGGYDVNLIKSNNIENLKKHKRTKSILAKELLQNFCEKKTTLMITAIPGMGKSLLMNYFALKMPIHLWVLDISLVKYRDHYKNWEGQNCNSQQLNFERFLKEAVMAQKTPNTEIFNSVFEQYLNNKKVVFLLDGLDEVPVNRQNGAMQLIKFINQSGYYMCVTTRPLLQKQLAFTLYTSAITLNMFTEDEQISFLSKYFADLGEVMPSNDNVQLFVDELLCSTELNLKDFDHRFTGVPLQTKLLAEVFENDFSKYLDDGIFKNQYFDLIDLYENFINKKIRIACAKVENASEAVIDCFKECRSLYGLRHLFDGQILQDLKIDEELFVINKHLPHALQQIQKDGITVIDGDSNVTFVHQTYAEYLVANWLAENINTSHKELVRKLIIKTFNRNFIVVRNMFDRILAKNCPLHTAIINNELDTVRKLIFDKNAFHVTDRGGRTILHLLSARESNRLVCSEIEELIRCRLMLANTILKNKMRHVEDQLLHYTVLDYAILSRSFEAARFLVYELKYPSCNINITKTETDYIICHIYCRYYIVLYVTILKCFIRTSFNEHEGTNIQKRIRNGDLHGVRSLISEQNVDDPDSKGCTLLHVATKGGHKNAVQFILKKKASVNKADDNGRSALHWASFCGDVEIISMLLSEGANTYATDCYNLTPYHYAILSSLENLADIVSLLLSRNRTITTQKFSAVNKIIYLDYGDEVHPVHLANMVTQKAVLNLILSHNVDANKKGFRGRTALMFAAKNNDIGSIKLLLANNADIHAQDDSYETALHHAAISGHAYVVTILLTNHADVNARGCNNMTPLHWAVFCRQQNVVTILLSKNADVNAKSSNNITPLHIAAMRGFPKILFILLTHGADIDAKDCRNNKTSLHFAVGEGSKNVVIILLDNGANVHVKSVDNETPLDIAVRKGYQDIVAILTKHL